MWIFPYIFQKSPKSTETHVHFEVLYLSQQRRKIFEFRKKRLILHIQEIKTAKYEKNYFFPKWL